MRPAVFLDRDGVLVRDDGPLTRSDQAVLFPDAASATASLGMAGFILVVVSNQTAIARGLASEEAVRQIDCCIQDLLRRSGGGQIERFYLCPHHPNATVPQYRVNCSCRKPRPGLLLQAAAELDLDLRASFMIGDRLSDIVAGHRAGCTTFMLETGRHADPPIQSDAFDDTVAPDFVCKCLAQATEIILQRPR